MLDLFSRRVVGWAASITNDRVLALAALERALGARRPGPGLVHPLRPRQPLRQRRVLGDRPDLRPQRRGLAGRFLVLTLDLAFIVRLARAMYEEQRALQRVIAGDSLEQATGWHEPYEDNGS